MVVVGVHPDYRFMDYCGIGTSTRKVAERIWGTRIPARPREELVRELYFEENRGAAAPSGSQDMVGLVYPGVSRIDYDFRHEGGVFPAMSNRTRTHPSPSGCRASSRSCPWRKDRQATTRWR